MKKYKSVIILFQVGGDASKNIVILMFYAKWTETGNQQRSQQQRAVIAGFEPALKFTRL